ncbi:MAG: ABC transporter permease subunit [Candidatus Heimdallarchaeota archaeon]|nr:ABC transporter permease subunit [Candidatus Heimdallarchaeota archaeon]
MSISKTNPVYALIKKEWIYNRGRILPLSIGLAIFGVLTIGMLMILPDIIPMIEGLMPELTPEMAIQSYMSNVNSIVSILAVILCADAIAGEREKNTLVLIRTKPIPVYSIILTKLFARYFIILIGTIIGTLFAYLFTSLLVGPVEIGSLLLSLAVYALILFVYMGIGILISTIAKSQISAGAISAGIVLVISLVTSFLVFDSIINYNAFQLSTNLLLSDFTPLVIALNCVALFIIGCVFIIITIILFESEKEPVRKYI